MGLSPRDRPRWKCPGRWAPPTPRARRLRSEPVDCLFHLRRVRAFSGSLVKGEVLVDSDEPEALTAGSLEVEVRVGHLQFPDEAGVEDLAARFFDVFGLDFQPHSPGASQELALIRDVPIEERYVEVVSQANEVPCGLGLGDLAAEY